MFDHVDQMVEYYSDAFVVPTKKKNIYLQLFLIYLKI